MKNGLWFFLLWLSIPAFAETPELLRAPILSTDMFGEGNTSRDMMRLWLVPQVEQAEFHWRENYEKLKTPEEVVAYQKRMKEAFLAAIGGFPERTPLEARTTGTLSREGLTIEKVMYQSQPGLWVTGLLYLPDEKKYPKPWNGVLVTCGHSDNGKGYPPYQRVAALHAYNGIAAFLVDPIDQGERYQCVDREAKKKLASGTHGHNLLGIGSILLGWNTARVEIWDLIRGLDYLQSRPEINPEQLGVAGLSGGGTQTAYIMALDDRVDVAASCCYLCSLMGLMKNNDPQDAEQNIFGQTAFGMDHADYCILRAPKPTLIGSATKDFFPIEMTWDSFRYAKRIFQRLGYGERLDLAETDNEHGYDQTLREATVRFMLRFLAHREEAIFEPEASLEFTDAEICVTPEGFTQLLPEARSTFDLNRDEAERLRKIRETNPISEASLPEIRRLAGVRELAAIPEVQVFSRSDWTKLDEKIRFQKITFQPEIGILLPAFLFASTEEDEKNPPECTIYVSDQGKLAAFESDILPRIQPGKRVLAIDLRGWGETQQVGQHYFRNENFGSDGKDFYTAYNLGKTYVGWRTEDILTVARWLQSQTASVSLFAVSQGCIPALHAAVLEKALFQKVQIARCPESWTEIVDLGENSRMPLTSTVHGALRLYDLPDLRRMAQAEVVPEATPEATPEVTPEAAPQK